MKAEDYLPLVKHVVERMQVKAPGYLEQEDLLSYGIFGLLEALEKYEPQRGVKFETFAVPRIRGAVLDAVRKANWLPRSLLDQLKAYTRALEKLEQRHGGEVSPEQVAEEMGISLEELHQLLAQASTQAIESLESFLLTKEENSITLGDTVADEKSPDPLGLVEERELKEALIKGIERLNEKDRLVLNLYYYEELTFKEIGQVLEVSESRVCQLHARALARLREYLKDFGVKTP